MGYKISYFLGGLLVTGAFIAQYLENSEPQGPGSNDTGPLILFAGGILLIFFGWREWMRTHRNN